MLATKDQILLDGAVWPSTAHATEDGDILVGGVRLSAAAQRYGTPVHVLDEADVRRRYRDFHRAFPDAEVAYAGKAFLRRAMAGGSPRRGCPSTSARR
jgi:diaminopimelate decarboxylase